MIKSELINALSKWSDDAVIELAIAVDVNSDEPAMEDKVWLEIAMVEEPNPDPADSNKHCLIFGGRVVMG